MTTTPDAPYAKKPEAVELVEQLRGIVSFFDSYVTTLPDRQGAEMLGVDFSIDDARTLVERWDKAAAWIARRDALQLAVVSHYKDARACRCPSCGKWRAETQRLFASRAAVDGPVN